MLAGARDRGRRSVFARRPVERAAGPGAGCQRVETGKSMCVVQEQR